MNNLSYVLMMCLALCSGINGISQDKPVQYKVEAPAIAKRDRPVKINHPAGAKVQAIYANVVAGSVSWTYLSEDHFERFDSYTIFAAPPGDYLITAGESTLLKVVGEGEVNPRPDPQPPKPEPKPSPTPKPDPKFKVAWAVWVYEQADAINQIPQTNTRLSIETRKLLESRGIKMAAYDDELEAAKPFVSVTKELPSLILSQDANNYRVFSAPKSVEDLKAILKEVTGE